MRFAVIKDSLVVNVIEAPKGWTVEGHVVVASDTAGPGDTYKDRNFTPEVKVVVASLRDKYARATTNAQRQDILAKQAGLID